MKKFYFAIAFLVSFHVLEKSDGMNPEEQRVRPMSTGSSSALVTNGGSRGVAHTMPHNTRRPSPSRRGENVGTVNRREAEFNIILPGDDMAAVKIYDKHDQTVLNTRDKMYPVQELIRRYHHDFAAGISYPVKQSFVSIDDEPLIVDRQVVINEFEDFEHGVVHERRRIENSLGEVMLEIYINTADGIQVIKRDEIKTEKSKPAKTA